MHSAPDSDISFSIRSSIFLVLALSLVLIELSQVSSVAPPRPSLTGISRKVRCPPPPSIDYLEIGTSDFGTILQAVDQLVAAGNPRFPFHKPLKGISVDAVPTYLNALPTQAEHHRKLNFAVTGVMPHPAFLPVYYLEPALIAEQGLPDYLRGCSRVGEPHPLALEMLANWNGLGDKTKEWLTVKDVPVLSISELVFFAGACRMSVLKVDVEGLDAELMLSYVGFLWANPQCRADILLYEERSLGRKGRPQEDYANMFPSVGAALRSVGYEKAFNPLGSQGYPLRDAYWVWSAARDSRLWAARAAAGAAAAVKSGEMFSAAAAAPHFALDEARLEALLRSGRGCPNVFIKENELARSSDGLACNYVGEWDLGAADADAVFSDACSAPIHPPAPDMPQGRTINATEPLRYIIAELIRRR